MSHAEEKEKALWASLTKAGIGKAYHRRSLREVAPEALIDWVSEPLAPLAAGEGWNLVGGNKAYDAAILVARGLMVQGQTSTVMPLRRMVEWIEADYQIEKLLMPQCLVVTGFNQTYPGVAVPFNGWQIKGVEELLTERLDQLGSVVLQMENPLGADSGWSAPFRERIANANRSTTL